MMNARARQYKNCGAPAAALRVLVTFPSVLWPRLLQILLFPPAPPAVPRTWRRSSPPEPYRAQASRWVMFVASDHSGIPAWIANPSDRASLGGFRSAGVRSVTRTGPGGTASTSAQIAESLIATNAGLSPMSTRHALANPCRELVNVRHHHLKAPVWARGHVYLPRDCICCTPAEALSGYLLQSVKADRCSFAGARRQKHASAEPNFSARSADGPSPGMRRT